MDRYFLLNLLIILSFSLIAIFVRMEERKRVEGNDVSADDFEILE
jgi:hypothetical protein